MKYLYTSEDGKRYGAMRTEAQTVARRANAAKATADRVAARAAHAEEDADFEFIRDHGLLNSRTASVIG